MAITYNNTLLLSAQDSVVDGPCTTTSVCSLAQTATGTGSEDGMFHATGTASANVDITDSGRLAGWTSVALNVISGSVTLDHGANYFRPFGEQTIGGPGFISVGSAEETPVAPSNGTIRMTATAGTQWEIVAVGKV